MGGAYVYYTVTLTAPQEVTEAAEKRLGELAPALFRAGKGWGRNGGESIWYDSCYGLDEEEAGEISRRFPGVRILYRYQAALGGSRHTVDLEFLNGAGRVLRDETEDLT